MNLWPNKYSIVKLINRDLVLLKTMDYQEYINQKKELYSNVIQFFECEKEDADTSFEDLINIIISQKIHPIA